MADGTEFRVTEGIELTSAKLELFNINELFLDESLTVRENKINQNTSILMVSAIINGFVTNTPNHINKKQPIDIFKV